MSRCTFLIAAALINSCSASADEHGHGEKEWEWMGSFDTPLNSYTWTAQSIKYAYADPAMKIVVLPAPNSTMMGLHELESEAAHSFEQTCIDVPEGGMFAAAEDTCYKIVFDANKGTSFYTINTTGVAQVGIFAEHMPTEFERDAHYLKDAAGEDIEPVAQEPDPSYVAPTEKHWGDAIGASFLVCICTLIGVAFLAPNIAKMGSNNPKILTVATQAFAAGALLAAAFYLMLFEATHLIVPISTEEAGQVAWWGSAVILGYVTAFLIEIIVFAIIGDAGDSDKVHTEASSTTDMGLPGSSPRNKRIRVLIGVLLGDFMHNFVDGIIIGIAFSGCGQSMGWSITASTIYHELAQEVSDYVVLTELGGLKPLVALFLNFVSGISVVLGAIIVLSNDVSNEAQALLLAYGAGIYVQIATTECMPKMHAIATTTNLRLIGFFFFALGCVAIGLVLMDHEHCVPAGGGGHGH